MDDSSLEDIDDDSSWEEIDEDSSLEDIDDDWIDETEDSTTRLDSSLVDSWDSWYWTLAEYSRAAFSWSLNQASYSRRFSASMLTRGGKLDG